MQIEIIEVKVENKGKYRMAQVSYKGPDGKVDGKKVPSFANKEVFKLLSEAKQGDLFNVKSEKVDGYWQWTAAETSGKSAVGESAAQRTSATVGRSTYETPEERAKKQVYIVRQSSVTAALALAELNGQSKVTPKDIIELAKEFEGYVFDIAAPVQEAEVV